MPDTTSNTKRIAKNTLMLYFRMIVVILVNLYTSRVILSVLGIDDYGIYNVVGGVLNIAIGKGDEEQLKKVFSTSLLIHILIGLFVVICAETIGLWFVNNKLVIPQERMFAANCVYQISIVSFFVNIMQVPYNASIIAHERMSVFAYITIIDVFLKLLIVYLLTYISYDKLIVYGILHLSVIIFIRQLYQIYCT